jgi:TPR repeat protein
MMVDFADQLNFTSQSRVFGVLTMGAEINGNLNDMEYLARFYEKGYGVPQDYVKAREWYENAAAKGSSSAMKSLGMLYEEGRVVPKDYAKAREWYEKAVAESGNADAMIRLGLQYENVYQDYAKAREWYEKAAADKDNFRAAVAMRNLALLYENAHGVPQDYAKAREWYEKAFSAEVSMERHLIETFLKMGRYDGALKLQEAYAVKVEEEETKRVGKPGGKTAKELNGVVWVALFAKDFPKALTVANRAHELFPDNLSIETNRAHALMFLERGEECRALYLTHKGKPLSEQDPKLWERVIAEDFAELGKAGLTHPMMADIKKELGVSP